MYKPPLSTSKALVYRAHTAVPSLLCMRSITSLILFSFSAAPCLWWSILTIAFSNVRHMYVSYVSWSKSDRRIILLRFCRQHYGCPTIGHVLNHASKRYSIAVCVSAASVTLGILFNQLFAQRRRRGHDIALSRRIRVAVHGDQVYGGSFRLGVTTCGRGPL